MTTLVLTSKSSNRGFFSKIATAFQRVDLWIQKHHQRRVLSQLDAWQREDLGLSDEQVRVESQKSFWR